MKNCIKKLAVTGALTILTVFTIMSASKAATVKVTGDTLNVRKSPSTDSKVVAMLFKGVECELLGEEGEWYKIKYKSYTGYISKQYSEVIGETSENEESNTPENNTSKENNNTENKEENNVTEKENNTEVNDEKITTEQITGEKETSKEPETVEIIYKKAKKELNIKILPLVYSDSIGKKSKGTEVVLLSQTTGWSYIQTDTISGWVRSDTLQDTDKKQENVSENNKDDSNNSSEENDSYTQKTAYVNENLVNVRKGAGTSYDVIKTLTLNSKVTITGEEDGWYKVKSGSDEGYILKQYLSDNQKVTTRSNTSNRTENKVVENTEKNEETKNTTEIENITETKKEETTEKKAETTEKKTETKKEQTTTKTEVEEKKETIKDTDVIAYAKKYLGYKYVYGGDGSNGTFDCSGFTMYVYKHFGISLPHGATSQYKSGKGTKISKQSDLQPGDIVFLTDYETGVGIGHCGIYIGNGNFIHASTTTYSVIISSLNTIYEGRFYVGLRLI